MNSCRSRSERRQWLWLPLIVWAVLGLIGCRPQQDFEYRDDEYAGRSDLDRLSLPELEKADLSAAERLHVIATTSVIGDVVARVGGEAIALNTLIGTGQDPHAYEPSARDLTAVFDAHVIFVNGWDLEAGLLDNLRNVAPEVPLVPVSAGVLPRTDGRSVDPHVWLDPHNVLQWVGNIELVLSDLDPQNASLYAARARAYRSELADLISYMDERAAAIPGSKRKLVTNHDSLGYFAERYGFEVLGAIIPAGDTLAEPSASGLSQLVDTMKRVNVCTIYAETTANDRLAQAAAAELDTCDRVQVLTLYTGAVGAAGSGADSYLGLMRFNIDTIAAGQGQE